MASIRKSSRVRVPTTKDSSVAKKKKSFKNSLVQSTVVSVHPAQPAVQETTVMEPMMLDSVLSSEIEDSVIERVPAAIFKDPNFVHSNIGMAGTKRTRVWKNLKQIVATERSLPWHASDVTYSSMDAPPSFKPAKKYSDLSGLTALYTDPQTKIRFANSEEFSRARLLPSDLITGYLTLRKASAPVP